MVKFLLRSTTKTYWLLIRDELKKLLHLPWTHQFKKQNYFLTLSVCTFLKNSKCGMSFDNVISYYTILKYWNVTIFFCCCKSFIYRFLIWNGQTHFKNQFLISIVQYFTPYTCIIAISVVSWLDTKLSFISFFTIQLMSF